MKKSNHLSIIKGGLKTVDEAPKKLISAYATKSRLMGCAWIFAQWEVFDCEETDEIIEYFYIDFDEYGIEDFHHLENPDKLKERVLEVTTVNCMGSVRVPLSLDQLSCLIFKYHEKTKERGHKLHENWRKYSFILDIAKEIYLEANSSTKLDEIKSKIYETSESTELSLCSFPSEINGIINYSLMRIFAKDEDIISSMISEEAKGNLKQIFDLQDQFTFLKNTISKGDTIDRKETFSCKSLIQSKKDTFVILSKVTMLNKKIYSIEIVDKLKISTPELALMLKKPEYIIIYQLEKEYLPLMELPLTSKIPITESSYENCYLYMAFKKDNDHVLDSNFELSGDIYGSYTLTLTNQIAISSSTLEGVNLLRKNLLSTPLEPYLKELRSVYLDVSTSYGFINCDFFEFTDFLDDLENPTLEY